jgi:hypothetical protein
MLRLLPEGDAEELPSLHHQEYSKPADTLYRVGQELSTKVGYLVIHIEGVLRIE